MTAAFNSTPTEIRKSGPSLLRITWADGHVSEFPARVLRARCPCATCVDENSGRRIFGESQVRPDIAMRKLELVGNYAVRVDWSDGHSTGLYSFDYLRRSCGCEACAS